MLGAPTTADMSVQYMTKGDPPSYNARLTHDYLQTADPNHPNHQSIENKVQQHSINDILNTSKQGRIYNYCLRRAPLGQFYNNK